MEYFKSKTAVKIVYVTNKTFNIGYKLSYFMPISFMAYIYFFDSSYLYAM